MNDLEKYNKAVAKYHASKRLIPVLVSYAFSFRFAPYSIFLIVITSFLLGLLATGKGFSAEQQLEPQAAPQLAPQAVNWTYVELTSYCPCSICCGKFADNKTSTNKSVFSYPYNFAADKSLPIGTRIYLPKGLGLLDNVRSNDRYFYVDDRGGALDTEAQRYGVIRLDLRVKDHWQAVKYGRRIVPVIIDIIK